MGDSRDWQISVEMRSLLAALATSDATLPPITFAPGDRISRYLLRREIGRGGFGVLFEAHDAELDRLVAVKLTRRGGGGLDQFRQEARAVARLSHANVVVVHDFGLVEELPYIVMERLHGETVRERLLRGAVPVGEALRIVAAAARGVAHAHHARLVHRDLKPSNVFLTSDGQVKVLDFGLALSFEERALFGGTPAFMAPEQWRGDAIDTRTDVFGLGMLLLVLLTGEPPQRDAAMPLDVAAALPGLPRPVVDVVAHALAHDPEKRIQTADALVAALDAALATLARPRRRALVVGLGLGGALLLAGVAGVAVTRVRAPIKVVATGTKILNYAANCGGDPSFAPAGHSFVYSGIVDGDYEIFALDPDRQTQRRLTHSAGWDYSPAISPDGKSVVYQHFDETPVELRVIPLDGGDEKSPPVVLGPSPARPAWTAAGRVIGSDATGHQILEWDLSQTPPRSQSFATLPGTGTLSRSSAYRDGTLVISWQTIGGIDDYSLGQVRRGEAVQTFSSQGAGATALEVDRQQRGYYYSALARPSPQLSWSRRGSFDPEAMPSILVPAGGMGVSSDGSYMAFSTCGQNLALARLRPGKPTDWLTRATTQDCCVSRLDTKRAIFSSKRSGRMQVWALDVATGEAQPLTEATTMWGAAAPDGKRLVFEKAGGILLQTVGANDPRQLTPGSEDRNPQLAFDGKTALFVRGGGDAGRLFRVAVDGGTATKISDQPIRAFAASPVADDVALLVPGAKDVRIALTSMRGATRWLAVPGGAYQNVRFSPDGKRLLVASENQIFETTVEHPELVTKWKSALASVGTVDYAPDGDGLVAELVEYTGDLWLAYGQFR